MRLVKLGNKNDLTYNLKFSIHMQDTMTPEMTNDNTLTQDKSIFQPILSHQHRYITTF